MMDFTEAKRTQFYDHAREIGLPASTIETLKKEVDQQLAHIDVQAKSRDTLLAKINGLDKQALDLLFQIAGLLYKRGEITTELTEVYARLNQIGIYPPGKAELPGGAAPGNPQHNLAQYLERFAAMFNYATDKPEDTVAWFERRRF